MKRKDADPHSSVYLTYYKWVLAGAHIRSNMDICRPESELIAYLGSANPNKEARIIKNQSTQNGQGEPLGTLDRPIRTISTRLNIDGTILDQKQTHQQTVRLVEFYLLASMLSCSSYLDMRYYPLDQLDFIMIMK
ncbi:unnamed protein product [Auanema sp. JU1783]|nr:unnamed protein product [Auanema sp. JU1783]